ncbi:unnamed protein product [Adineta ricciae]|uniref:Uncharacterized protein n=1 Tax=Adineta ricciae TaxID=249248 RepID=A0A814UGC1_ADIRI|nr:unnamed protein product [Adineta ricciae]
MKVESVGLFNVLEKQSDAANFLPMVIVGQILAHVFHAFRKQLYQSMKHLKNNVAVEFDISINNKCNDLDL